MDKMTPYPILHTVLFSEIQPRDLGLDTDVLTTVKFKKKKSKRAFSTKLPVNFQGVKI